MNRLILSLAAGLLLSGPAAMAQEHFTEYKVDRSVSLGGDGGWDYLVVDKPSQRLFVSHGTRVEVVDLKTDRLTGQIPNTPGVHGIAVVPALNKGFITAGRIDSVVVFDLKTLAVVDRIATGKNPDAILYDPFSRRIFTFNGRSNSITAIDALTNKVAGTLPVSGKPEAAVSDGKGNIFCNIEDRSTVVKFDATTLKIEAEWPLDPGREPTGLDIDLENNRLFSACSGSAQVVVLDARTGKAVATIPIGQGCDGVVFVPGDHAVVAANGEGTVTVIRQSGPDDYRVVRTLPTRERARTITYDETTGRFYLPSAEVVMDNGKRKTVPGTFMITVISK